MATARAMPLLMGDVRAFDAIARIERALARIEASSRKQAASPSDPAELTDLRHAHSALRARVESAIGQIDHLLESEGN